MKVIKKIIQICGFALIYILLSVVIRVDYSVIAPGGISKLSDAIKIEGEYETNAKFYTTYVYYMQRLPASFKMILELDNHNEVEKISHFAKTISNKTDYQMGQVSNKASYYAALISAYKAAAIKDPTIEIEYEINSLILYYRPDKLKDKLKIGDIITKIAGKSINLDNYEELIQEAKTLNPLKISVLRQNQETEITITYEKGDYALAFYPNVEVIKANPKYDFPGLNGRFGGPSGGLMQAIKIYVSLIKLNLKDLKIAGTGTIDLSGKVGKIGGAVQKIHTVNKAGVDVFFIAKGNDNEVINLKKNFAYYPVETLLDALTILERNYTE